MISIMIDMPITEKYLVELVIVLSLLYHMCHVRKLYYSHMLYQKYKSNDENKI